MIIHTYPYVIWCDEEVRENILQQCCTFKHVYNTVNQPVVMYCFIRVD
jgi:hypothetical protein